MQQQQVETITEDQIKELATLIAQATEAGDSATSFSAHRLRICVDVGRRLTQAKMLIPRGQWEQWCSDHLPDLPERSRQRWMRLAEADAKGCLDLESARGLRHAYTLAGLLPDGDGNHGRQAEKPVSYVVHIARLVSNLQRINIDALSPGERNELKTRLAPVTAFMGRL